MSTLKASVEVGFDSERGLLTFTQVLPEEVDEKFPSHPWPDMAYAFGFFDDVVKLVDQEVKQFRDVCQAPKRTVTLRFKRRQVLPPSSEHLRCANSWLKIEKDMEAGVLTIELHRVPGRYKDFVLLDVLDHLEGRAGRGKNRHVDGRPGVLRQKLWRAVEHGPLVLEDSDFRPKSIPAEERVRTDED